MIHLFSVKTALSDGDKEAPIRKGLELAKAGDVPMLKFFLSPILPRRTSDHNRSNPRWKLPTTQLMRSPQ